MVFIAVTVLTASGDQPVDASGGRTFGLTGQASHGLRAYLDPSTGEYERQPDLAPLNDLHSLFTAQVQPSQPTTRALTEFKSPRVGGGFSIDLQQRFRPYRQQPDT